MVYEVTQDRAPRSTFVVVAGPGRNERSGRGQGGKEERHHALLFFPYLALRPTDDDSLLLSQSKYVGDMIGQGLFVTHEVTQACAPTITNCRGYYWQGLSNRSNPTVASTQFQKSIARGNAASRANTSRTTFARTGVALPGRINLSHHHEVFASRQELTTAVANSVAPPVRVELTSPVVQATDPPSSRGCKERSLLPERAGESGACGEQLSVHRFARARSGSNKKSPRINLMRERPCGLALCR